LEDEELNLSELDDHLRSHVIHRPEFQQLGQEYQRLLQLVLPQQEQEFQLPVQELQRPLQVLRQQELTLQLQRLLQLLQLQLF